MRTVLTLACAAALLAGCNQETAASDPAAAAAVQASAVEPTAQTFPAGSMPLSAVQVSATLLTLTGVDSATAAATGRVTDADARALCERAPNGEAAQGPMPQCIADILGSEAEGDGGGLHTASADCVSGTMSSSDWGDFRLTGTETRGGDQLYPVFMNSDGGQALGNAGGEYPVTAMFEILCPARAAAWKAN